MIKVLHITGSMNRGGAEVMLMDLLRHKNKDIHFDFLVHYHKKKGMAKGDFDDEIKREGAEIYYCPRMLDMGISRYVKRLKKIFGRVGPDIVHIHMNSKSGFVAYAAYLAGIKTIITHSHADIKFRGNWFYNFIANGEFWLQKILIDQYSTHFWGCSAQACNSLFKKSRRDRFQIINNAVNVENYHNVSTRQTADFRTNNNIPHNGIILGNVGRIVRHKNILFVLEVLKELIKENPGYIFLYAGREDNVSYHSQVKDKIHEYGLSAHVVYLGLRDDIALIMNAIDVFIGPALQEGFGLVAIEAQAACKPCILYKGFPQAVDMQLGLVEFVDDFEVKKWMAAIRAASKLESPAKSTVLNKLQALGFDSRSNANEVSNLYISSSQNG